MQLFTNFIFPYLLLVRIRGLIRANVIVRRGEIPFVLFYNCVGQLLLQIDFLREIRVCLFCKGAKRAKALTTSRLGIRKCGIVVNSLSSE